jgi:predicted kinase
VKEATVREHIMPIFIVVGPPAVGKSTAARALAAHFPQSIHLPVDDLRHMVVSGLELPSAEWSAALEQQITLARSSCIQIACAYRSAGFMVVIDDFWDAQVLTDYRPLLTHPHVHHVLLYPEQARAYQRNTQRSGTDAAAAYIAEGIGIVYYQLQDAVPQLAQLGWQVLDTTTLTPEETASAMLRAVTG